MATEPESRGWWHTVPGILTGVAAVIGGVGTLLVALTSIGVFKPVDQSLKPPSTSVQSPPKSLPQLKIPESTPLAAAIPSGRGVIVNAHSGLCLTVAGGETAKNITAVQYLCDGDPSRSWNLTALQGADTFKITNSNSGLCLAIAGGGTAKNIIAIQSSCDNDPSQQWRYTKVDESTFRLVNVNSRLCLTIAGGRTDKNAEAVQYLCDGDPSRDWRFRSAP